MQSLLSLNLDVVILGDNALIVLIFASATLLRLQWSEPLYPFSNVVVLDVKVIAHAHFYLLIIWIL